MELEFKRLEYAWEKLPERVRGAILVLGGVRGIPMPEGYAPRKFKRARKGEEPEWLPLAMTLLRDGGINITDREIARRVGISHSQLCRNETFRSARESYRLPIPAGLRGKKRMLAARELMGLR